MIYAPILGGGLALLLLMLSYPIRILAGGYRSRSLFGRYRPIAFRGLRRSGAAVGFLFDFFAAVFCALVIVVYDCGYLGGGLRLHHVALALLGAAFVRFIYRLFLGRVLEGALSLVLDLLLYTLFLLSLPLRLLFGAICRFFYHTLLICRQKHDKIKENRIATRYRRRELARAETAYLPHSFFVAGGTSEEEAYGSDSSN